MPIVSPTVGTLYPPEANAAGVSWPAVFGGAFVTAALWVTLTILGVGLGLYAISPWAGQGASAKTIGVGAIVWLIVTQIIASGLGGYLAGRLRTKWTAIHTNEVYFRDTAHGFLVWAVAVVFSAVFLGIVLAAVAATTGTSVTPVAYTDPVPPNRAVTPGGSMNMPGTYSSTPGSTSPSTPGASMSTPDLTDTTTPGVAMTTPGVVKPAPGSVSSSGVGTVPAPGSPGAMTGKPGADPSAPGVGKTPPGTYRTPGAAPGEITVTPHELDKARRAAARTCLWIFVALFIGAFCASLSATLGGRERDAVEYVAVDDATLTTGAGRPYEAPVV